MSIAIIVLLLVFIAILLLRQFARDIPAEPTAWPLIPRPILTLREQKLFHLINSIYPEHFLFVQVALSQLISVKPGTAHGQSIRNQYAQLVADFVLCRRDFGIVAVIELDDASHAAPDRQAADDRKTRAIQAAGMRLVRISAGTLPTIDQLRNLIGHSTQTEHEIVVSPTPKTEAASPLKSVVAFALVGVLVLGGCIALFRRAKNPIPAPMHHDLTAILPKPATLPTSVSPPSIPTAPLLAVNEAAIRQVEQNRLDDMRATAALQSAAALERRKQAAWAEYYHAAAFCEHPPTWSDQVDCGNQYIRAKKEFEKLWNSQLASSASVTELN